MSTSPISHLQAAGEQLGVARDQIIVGVADAVNSSVDAAREVKAKVGENLDSLLDQGKDLLGQAGEVIRSRPWATVGVAVAAGYLLAKFAKRG
jgi:ElaB/YqjD/DUF883 family membrane-anchored ribosome-binding protein